MADKRTVTLTILGDSDNVEKALSKTAAAADKTADHLGGAGEKMHHAGEKTEEGGKRGQEALEKLSAAAAKSGQSFGPIAEVSEGFVGVMDSMSEHGSRTSKTLAGIGTAAGVMGGLVTAAAARDQATLAQLEVAVKNAGEKFEDVGHELEESAESMARYGHTANDAIDALTKLTTASGSTEKATEDMQLVADLAARKHLSLAEAGGIVARVYGGNTKVLREFGIQTGDIVNAQGELTKAHLAGVKATERLGKAQEALGELEERVAEKAEAAQEKHEAAVEAANTALEGAEEHLADVSESVAERRQAAQEKADEQVKASSERLASARQHLADVEESIAERTKVSTSDLYALADAQQHLSDVQEKIADGALAGQAATEALRDAQTALTRQQADQADKHKVSTSESHQLRDAHAAVAGAVDDHTAAVGKASSAAQETISEQHQVRDALEAVAAARAKLTAAENAPVGGATLAELQQEKKLREEVAEATEAQKKATEDKEKAEADEHAYGDKVEAAIKALQGKLKGSADAAAGTFEGRIRRMVATVENEFAKLGPNFGVTLLGIGAAIDIFVAVGGAKLFTGAAAMGVRFLTPWVLTIADFVAATTAGLAATLVEAGVWAAGMVVAGATALLPFLPIIAAVGAVIAVAVLLYKHWDQVWGFIKKITSGAFAFIKEHFDLIVSVAFGPLGLAMSFLHDHWDAIVKGLRTAASHLKDAFVTIFKDLTKPLRWELQLMINVVNAVIGAINGIHFGIHPPAFTHLPSYDFNGFNIPKLPDLPQFAAGGFVPGPYGAPVPIGAHGGELVLNPGQQAAVSALMRGRGGAGLGGGPIHLHLHLDGALIADERAARTVGLRVADGVHEGLLKKKSRGNDLHLASR